MVVCNPSCQRDDFEGIELLLHRDTVPQLIKLNQVPDQFAEYCTLVGLIAERKVVSSGCDLCMLRNSIGDWVLESVWLVYFEPGSCMPAANQLGWSLFGSASVLAAKFIITGIHK